MERYHGREINVNNGEYYWHISPIHRNQRAGVERSEQGGACVMGNSQVQGKSWNLLAKGCNETL
jgi:hypothetical protein